jgi:hypothetical protein
MKHLIGRNRLGSALLLLVSLACCTTTTIDEFRQGETGIEASESVVILGRRQASDYETRSQFVECVGEQMTQGEDSVNVVPEQEFVDAMFPWFEPRTAPLRTRDLERLMTEVAVADRMTEFGVRYMVWLDGPTEQSNRGGSISCVVSPGGGGCFGFGSWEDNSSFLAKVWDVNSLTDVGTISTDATGQSYLPAFVIPIPLIARVEANACSRLAIQLKEFLNDGS